MKDVGWIIYTPKIFLKPKLPLPASIYFNPFYKNKTKVSSLKLPIAPDTLKKERLLSIFSSTASNAQTSAHELCCNGKIKLFKINRTKKNLRKLCLLRAKIEKGALSQWGFSRRCPFQISTKGILYLFSKFF